MFFLNLYCLHFINNSTGFLFYYTLKLIYEQLYYIKNEQIASWRAQPPPPKKDQNGNLIILLLIFKELYMSSEYNVVEDVQ